MFKRFFIICLTFLCFLSGCVSKNDIGYLDKYEINMKKISLKISYFERDDYDSNWIKIKIEVTNKMDEHCNVKISNYYLYSKEDNCKYESILINTIGDNIVSEEVTWYRSSNHILVLPFHVQRKVNEDNYYFAVKINNEKYKFYLKG